MSESAPDAVAIAWAALASLTDTAMPPVAEASPVALDSTGTERESCPLDAATPSAAPDSVTGCVIAPVAVA